MKMFGRSGGYWLFWTSFFYFIVGVVCAFFYKEIPAELVQLVWLFVLILPIVIKPLARWLNMKTIWEV